MLVQQKAPVSSVGIDVIAHDLPAVVDADRLAGLNNSVRMVDRCEVPVSVLEVAVAGDVVGADELTAIVDVDDDRVACCAGELIGVKTPASSRNPCVPVC
jgi:hypothetical protein